MQLDGSVGVVLVGLESTVWTFGSTRQPKSDTKHIALLLDLVLDYVSPGELGQNDLSQG